MPWRQEFNALGLASDLDRPWTMEGRVFGNFQVEGEIRKRVQAPMDVTDMDMSSGFSNSQRGSSMVLPPCRDDQILTGDAQSHADRQHCIVDESKRSYELRLYDKPLLTFEFTIAESPQIGTSITAMHSNDRELFPIELALSQKDFPHEELLMWLDSRVIPIGRTFSEKILGAFGLAANYVNGIIDVSKGLSLNDCYWVVPSGFSGTFSEYNLYENRFSETIAHVAYTGVEATDAAFSISPELTTDGMLPKAWRIIDGKGIFLYKGGTSGYANAGLEPYSEFYASQIANEMELNCVDYDLEEWEGKIASTCKLFTDIGISFVSIGRIVTAGGLPAILRYHDDHGQKFSDSIRDMLMFDALVYNTDRHYGNFGVLRVNSTGQIIGPAPIFDNGASLFCYGMEDDIKNLDEYATSLDPAFEFMLGDALVNEIFSQRQIAKLRRMLGFEYRRHPSINLPEWRLKAIEKHLQKRVAFLLGLVK
jgi:hypothetical protein